MSVTVVYQVVCSNGSVLTVRQTVAQARETYKELGWQLSEQAGD